MRDVLLNILAKCSTGHQIFLLVFHSSTSTTEQRHSADNSKTILQGLVHMDRIQRYYSSYSDSEKIYEQMQKTALIDTYSKSSHIESFDNDGSDQGRTRSYRRIDA